LSEQATTMWTLMSAIKTKLLTFQNTTLSSVKLWKIGVFSPQWGFPVLSIMPVDEVYSNYESGGRYRVTRTINIEVWSKLLKRGKALEQCEDIISAVKDIVQDNIDWSDNAIDTVMDTEVYEPVNEYQTAILPLRVRSLETVPTVSSVGTVAEINSDDLIQQMFTTIVGYKTSGTPSLSEINNFYRSYEMVVVKPPAVTLYEDSLKRVRRWAGADNPNRNFRLVSWTPLMERESNLELNIAIMEKLKDIVQVNYKWAGKAWNTLVTRVSYDQVRTEGFPLYASSLEYIVNCIEPH